MKFLKMVQFYWGKNTAHKYLKESSIPTIMHIDWIRNVISVQPDARILVTAIPDPLDIFEFFVNDYKCLHKTRNLKGKVKTKIFFF